MKIFGVPIGNAFHVTSAKVIAALGYTPENAGNKKTVTGPSDTFYMSQKATTDAINAAVAGLLDDRGNFDASGNLFPSTGGSGTAGAVAKGDIWYISVAGTLGGQAVQVADSVRAMADAPGQTAGNWDILDTNVTAATLGALINAAASATPNDADLVATVDTSVVKNITWTAVKAFLKTYFDTLYAPGTNNFGYLNIPQNSRSSDYTTAIADAGKHIYQTGATKTVTIDSNANVAYPIGTAITFIAVNATGCSIAITDDTMTLANSTTTGTRTLAQNGIATAIKITSTSWLISGTGLT